MKSFSLPFRTITEIMEEGFGGKKAPCWGRNACPLASSLVGFPHSGVQLLPYSKKVYFQKTKNQSFKGTKLTTEQECFHSFRGGGSFQRPPFCGRRDRTSCFPLTRPSCVRSPWYLNDRTFMGHRRAPRRSQPGTSLVTGADRVCQ